MKKQYDVVIVGCGVAGCFTALHLPKETQILMLSKSELEESGPLRVPLERPIPLGTRLGKSPAFPR